MFAEYLKRHPLTELLADGGQALYPAAGDPAWGGVSQAHREEITREAAAWRKKPYPMRTASGFLAFVRDGSRAADEAPYFSRRRKLCWAALDACVNGESPIDEVIDGLWCICEETAWVISAHNVNPIPGAPAAKDYPLPDKDRPYIDLFAAQTGMILALAAHFTKDRLDSVSPLIRRRVQQEIDARILRPFMDTDDFWWMGVRRSDLNNWTPWILSNVMVCACLSPMNRDSLARLLERACLILDRWLQTVPQDGGCDEGAGYWNMAGGALLDCLEILEKATDRRMAFWQDGKIRNILTFPLKAEIGGGWFANFADCDARPFISGERLQYAGERLGDGALVSMGCRLRGTLADQMNDVPHLTRVLALLFHPAAQALPEGQKEDAWLNDLQFRLVRRGGLALCCKGGHNGENHNHNDVGSFMLYVDGQPVVIDAGNMVYTAKTFSAQRYTLWNTRSAYHNLPLIGGGEQQPGRAFAARDVRCLPDGLEMDIASAYAADAGVRSLRRTLRLSQDRLILRDAVELERALPVTWVFMLSSRPALEGGRLHIGGMRLDVPEGCRCDMEEIPVTDPRMARNYPGSLWRVLLTAPAAQAFDMTFVIRREERYGG